jgi:hypothetical protein
MHRNELRDHIFGAYVSLRYGIAVIGAVLPLLVYVIGVIHGVELQSSTTRASPLRKTSP